MGELAVHELDMVIADCPMPGNINVQAFNHILGSSNIEFFAAPKLISKLKGSFPPFYTSATYSCTRTYCRN